MGNILYNINNNININNNNNIGIMWFLWRNWWTFT